jgi:hypothetical protein
MLGYFLVSLPSVVYSALTAARLISRILLFSLGCRFYSHQTPSSPASPG